MTTVLDTPRPPGRTQAPPSVNRARSLCAEERADFSHDAVEAMIDEYARHVESLLDPRAGHSRLEYAYGRLFGSRGNVCRICTPADMAKLDRRAEQRWRWAESHLRDYLGGSRAQADAASLSRLIDIAQRVEQGWADSLERYITTLSTRLSDCDIPDQIGILKGIDTVGVHLAQREIFEISHALAVPLENANAVKLRVRLTALFLTLHRCRFSHAYPAIQSYRRTFRIDDPVAYPWWFVDCRLTERQLNWTYKRMPVEHFDWRF